MDLALNVFESVKSYYQIARKDLSRNGTTMRKIVCESVSGSAIRNANQLNLLAESLGARRQTLFDMSKMRVLTDENENLVHLVEKIARKPPEGGKIISMEWKIKAGHFYEQENISDVIKGHHCVYKVCFVLTELALQIFGPTCLKAFLERNHDIMNYLTGCHFFKLRI